MRWPGALLFLLALTTCKDNPIAPGHGGRASLAVQPVLTDPVNLSAFGLTIDSLRVTVVRPVADTVADATVYFSPDSTEIHLGIALVLRAPVETLRVQLALSAGGVVLFTGADTVPVAVGGGGGGGGSPPVTIPMNYSGPGAGVDRLIVTPLDTVLLLNDSLRIRVAAESLGVPVTAFYVHWTTSDTSRARINAFGVLRAPNRRDTITVIARTITGVADSTRVTFAPAPTSLAITSGDGQTALAGAGLPAPLRVRVTATDGLGVKGAVVQFQALAAGATVTAAIVAADDSGFAETGATLGPTGGAQQFRASVAGLTPVTFNANALAAAVHSADVIANETWAAAQSPHVVTAYLRVRNNATLTIAAGAVVKFDAGAGLQVGDTTLGESGGLVLDGTAAPIMMTANSGSPASGFWKGLEVQKSLAGPAWRRVLVEWGGGVRAAFGGNGPCILVADRSGAAVDLDSLHLRQCGGAGGVVVVDGSVHLHRSVVDSTGLAGIAATNGLIEVDSTAFRGVTTGVQLPNKVVRLGPSSANQFLGNGVPIQLHAFQLPGLLRQDTIGGNTTNHIIVTTGQPDPAAPVVTLFRQPRGPTGFDYEVTGGGAPLDIGSASGQALVLDSNVVVGFDRGAGLLIGDSAGTRSGTIRSLGTSRANAPRLTSTQAVPAPGDWVGVEIGRLFADDILKNVRIEYAGDSVAGQAHRFGLLIRNPATFRLVLDSVVVAHTGLASPDTNSAGVLVGAAGAGVEIRRSVADSNRGYGFAVAATPVRVVDDTARENYIGLVSFVAGGGSIVAGDSLARNMLGPGNTYPLQLLVGSLPMLYTNTMAGNQRDTLLLGVTPPAGQQVIVKTQGPLPPPPATTSGNGLYVPAVLPEVPGQRWRVLGPIVLDSLASLSIKADTVVFDSTGGITVGGAVAAGLQADGTTRGAGFYKLFTAAPGHARWDGIEFDNVANGGVLFRNVIVEKAGLFIPPTFGCDCNGTAIAGIRVFDDTSGVTFSLDNLIVRQSITIALDVNRGASVANVAVLSSQFYENPWSPMIRSPDPRQLVIHGSDLYHYHSQVIQSSFAGTDSVDAVDNWWGDVSGPDSTFSFADSLGRVSFDGNAVRYQPYATGPFFPVGPATTLVAARDTVLPAGDTVLTVLGQRDSIRVRVLDPEGRGVGGLVLSWASSNINDTIFRGPLQTDLGGRNAVTWHISDQAGPRVATASGVGTPVVFPVVILPGNTVGGVNWQLDAGYTQGQVTGLKAVTFASTNRQARIIGNAHDGHGNGTAPNEICFVDPGGPCAVGYGQLDSLKGDTIYFRPLTNLPPTFVLRGLYELGLGGQDSVMITMGQITAGVRIDRDVTTPGTVDTLPNPYRFVALCRNGNPSFGPCQREFQAFVVDSENAPIGNGAANFVWSSPGAPDTTITITGIQGGLAHDTVFVQAHDNGTTWLKVVNTGAQGGQDSLPILVQQEAFTIGTAPFSDTLLVGETATFRAAALDVGGDTIRGMTVHWRIDEAPPHLSILDTSVANQVTVRLDSLPLNGQTAVAAYTVRAPGDTLFQFAYVFNPVVTSVAAGDPLRVAVDPVRRQVYATDVERSSLHVFDADAEREITNITGMPGANGVAVYPRTGDVYVSRNDGVVSHVDGAGQKLLESEPVGLDLGFVAVDTTDRERVFVTAADVRAQYWLFALDGKNLANHLDSVPISSRGFGIAYNARLSRVYVVQNNEDSLAIFDASGSLRQVAKLGLGQASYDVAVNPVTNRVYVTESTSQQVKVIDGESNTPIDSISVGSNVYPEGLDVDPVRNRVYVARPGSGAPRGGVTVIDIADIDKPQIINFSGILSPWVVDVKADPVTGRVYGLDTSNRVLIILHFTP